MPPKPQRSTQPSSQLIKTLQSLSVLASAAPHSRFVATVGRFIDISQAFGLADFLSRIPDITAQTQSGDTSAQSLYLNARGQMMAAIATSLSEDAAERARASLRLPMSGDEHFSEKDQGLSGYMRFYSLHQSEMEAHITQLHTRIRRQLSTQSATLAQLAALDGKLNDILTSYKRQAFAVIPSLMAQRFHYLLNESELSQDKAQALSAFFAEMQTVLFAELDIRLQPTLGLIEALTLKEEEENS